MAKPGCLVRWSRAARVNVFGSQGEAQASWVARSNSFRVLAVANHLPGSPGVEAMRWPSSLSGASSGYFSDSALKVDRLELAWLASSANWSKASARRSALSRSEEHTSEL